MLILASGATLKRSEKSEGWVIVCANGVEAPAEQSPHFALLLLEQEPSSTMQLLPGFPFERVIEAGQRSRLPRYAAQAAVWQEALNASK